MPKIIWVAIAIAIVAVPVAVAISILRSGACATEVVFEQADGTITTTKYDCGPKKAGEEVKGKIEIEPEESTEPSPELTCVTEVRDDTGRTLTEPEVVDITEFGSSDLPSVTLPETEESIAASINVECSRATGPPVAQTAHAIQIEPSE